jgi:hypothetical protein
MKRLSVLLPLLAVLALFGESRARAGQINFTYDWNSSPPSFITGPGNTGNVQIATAQSTTTPVTVGGPAVSIPAATLTTTAAPGAKDTYNASFSLLLKLTDGVSNTSQNLTFNSTVSGSIDLTGPNPQSSLFANFQNPLTQTLTFGNLVYTVTIDPSSLHLPAPGATNLGQINANVSVASVTTPSGTPEPSSLVLGAIALSLAGLARRNRRKVLPV